MIIYYGKSRFASLDGIWDIQIMDLKPFCKYAPVPAYLVYSKHFETNLILPLGAYLMLKIDKNLMYLWKS